MKLARGALLAISFILVTGRTYSAPPTAERMRFDLHAPNRMYAAITGDSAWSIYASGEIDSGAPDRLTSLVARNHIPSGSAVYFNSPGGSLIAGMTLGKVIRSARFTTDVGQYSASNEGHSLPGQCYSACTVAYLGGTWRYLSSGSVYGVHRFYFSKPTGADSDTAQILSAVVVQYIRDMGADPELFSEMTLAGKEEITVIPEHELERLNVVNNGQTPADWSVVSTNGVVYLRGQRDTAFGGNKLLLACTTDGVDLTVVMDPLSNGLMPPISAISFNIGETSYPIEAYISKPPELNNGSVFVSFTLPSNIVRALETAHKVGIEFQFAREAPAFVGFLDLDFDDGAKKMSGVLRGCLPD